MDMQEPGPSQPKKRHVQTDKATADEPPFIPECEVFLEGESDVKGCFGRCKKNPGHKDFIPVDKFTVDCLPEACRSEKFMKVIQNTCARTVKLRIKYTSPSRPDTYPNSTAPYPDSHLKGSKRAVRCGTGVIYYIRPTKIKGKPCPCHLCQSSGPPEMEFAKVEVFTSAHVVFDDLEAKHTVCEVFYDSEDRAGVQFLYGVKELKNGSGGDCPVTGIRDTKCITDKSFFQCVTHDMEFFQVLLSKMSGIYPSYYGLSSLEFIVSHPHGFSKHISIGKERHYTVQATRKYSPENGYYIHVGTWCDVDEAYGELPKATIVDSFEIVHIRNMRPARHRTDVPGSGTLTDSLLVRLPPGTPQSVQLIHEGSHIDWLRFPKETKFISLNGKKSYFLLHFKFFVPQMIDIFQGKYLSFFTTYDTATCPGSSGAQVVSDNASVYELDWTTHFASLSNGRNRSGINRHFILHTAPMYT